MILNFYGKEIASEAAFQIRNMKQSAEYLKLKRPAEYKIGIIFDFPMEKVEKSVNSAVYIPFTDIPHFNSMSGHCLLGNLFGKEVIIMQGRINFYDGHKINVNNKKRKKQLLTRFSMKI